MPLFAVVTESPAEGILRNVAAGLIVALVIAVVGIIGRYGKRIVIAVQTLIKSLEAADKDFTTRLELHQAADEAYQHDTTHKLKRIDDHLGRQDERQTKLEQAIETLAIRKTSAIEKAERAATQATIAASEASGAAKLSIETAGRIESKLDHLTARVADLPQVSN